MKSSLPFGLFVLTSLASFAQESLPPLVDGSVPGSLDQLWNQYDPRREPLEVEVTKEWEQDGILCRVIRYQVGIFKGSPAKVAAFFAVPKDGTKLPGLLQIHGGGQSANLDAVLTDAKRGYASLSLNWGGNKMNLGKAGIYEGPNTDWGKLDATHPPQRNKVNHFAGGISPDEFTLDPVLSPRNSNWFLVVVAARRALTFLEQQPAVDRERLGVYGHSMGGRLTTHLTGIDNRIKAAAPSCGGSGDVLESQTEVPGGRRSKLSPLELACVSENPYIERIKVPTLWLSPTNDFHAHLDDMAYTWRNVPEKLLRLSVSPHLNHRHSDPHQITQHLWFEEHLKGAFKMPQTPQLVLNLKTPDGVPELIVTPDASLPVKYVDIYYSSDPHGLTRFWRDALAVRDGVRWKASAPVMNLEQPLFAYATVVYDTPSQYRNLPMAPGQGNTEVFAISSREVSALGSQLAAASVRATDKPERIIDDGTRGWHDWYRLNWGNGSLWLAATRKPKDAKWRGPDGGKLTFEINPATDASLVVKVTANDWGAFGPGSKAEYYVRKELKGGSEWQLVSVGIEELAAVDSRTAAPLANWQTVTELSISPSTELLRDGQKVPLSGKAWTKPGDTRIRNLRWEGGEYKASSSSGAPLSPEEQQRTFNEAIRKSLEQERLDRK